LDRRVEHGRVDLIVLDRQVTFDEITVVLRIEDGLLRLRPAKAVMASIESHRVNIRNSQRSPTSRRSITAARLPGVQA
jgi:hypothetical protein